MNMSTTFSNRVLNQTNIVTDKKHSTRSSDIQVRVQEHGALIGFVVGAGVVLIIIIVLAVFLIRRCMKRKSKNLNSKPPVISNNVHKGNGAVNAAYTDVDEEFPYKKNHARSHLQNPDKEFEPYPVSFNDEGSFVSSIESYIDTATNVEESTIVVDQDEPKPGEELNNIKNINEHLGHVHKRPSFYLEPRDMDIISISDKVSFNNGTRE
ncbi:hypothetical protein ACJMK2_022169 [Sinanodonta woodiana]|uniref:Uncharacterized protein n=1 Tax=Sinanodonta woodiana TaxID=1069815 RepID=A0ABD3TK94_SINWO